LNSCKSLLFHGGDTGSIPVRDAKVINNLQEIPFSPEQMGIEPILDASNQFRAKYLKEAVESFEGSYCQSVSVIVLKRRAQNFKTQ